MVSLLVHPIVNKYLRLLCCRSIFRMPHYAEIGKASKDLFLGNPKCGAFNFDSKLSFASTTSSGVAFAVNAIKKAERVDGTLKISYSTKKYSADCTVDPAGKVQVAASLADVAAPGLRLSGSATLPDPSSAKLSVDYVFPYLSIKSSVALTSAPLIDVAAATSYKGFLLGGETAYDTSMSALTKYNLAAGYQAGDYQVTVALADKASTAKVSFAHNVDGTTTVGAEVARKVSSGETTFTLGYAKKLTSGALAKVKVDNSGTVSTLYETRLASGEKVAGSLQLHATDLSKPLKYGFALDLA
ncbi:hypothetical protein CEUSTIGMA_g6344.t1 [Chlamydomonas eustigma]|uniref:Uncharacterized protein n=1 Tax=Chlamydomonas eustigma TaxID=1157962 RepID=A0A250X764_9CHLO|nr:hypothetical protein CEUSTIGMA_g6344.t1 [Chlamydomonas eustigma]|eukprot:GAX78905.1 hypothetical protein CEUSTIGMA_g6344.t1 [Chlamydomonas eustigma]